MLLKIKRKDVKAIQNVQFELSFSKAACYENINTIFKTRY